MDDKKFQFNFFFTLRKMAIHSSLVMFYALFTVAVAWAILFGARTIRSRHNAE
jgi:hypothetical protein